jgi:hypothetical protein
MLTVPLYFIAVFTVREKKHCKQDQHFLFPKFKFLKDGWKEILPDKMNTFYSLCMRHLKISEGADKKDIWDRMIVPSVMRKYQHMKCNLNNVVPGHFNLDI